MSKIQEKAPTKIILIGEHSVVYGKPALVCAIDLYCNCEVRNCDGSSIILKDEKDSYKGKYEIEEIINLKKSFDCKDKKDRLFKITLNEVLKYLKIKNIKPFEVVIKKEISLGGCGLSTSAIVSVTKALSKYFDKNLDERDLFNIAMIVETRFHNYKSSGADQAAIVYRGLIKYQKKENGFDCKKLDVQADILKNFLVISSGKPEVSTGEVVENVRKQKEKNPKRIKKIFNNLENLTKKLLSSLKENNNNKFYNIIDMASDELIDLGIVTSNTQKLICDLGNLGAHTKVSGAGAHKGEGSGALICFGGEKDRIENYLRENKINYFRVNVAE